MGELAKTLVSLSGPSAVHGFVPWALVSPIDGSENELENGSHSDVRGVGKALEASISEKDLEVLDRQATTTLPRLTEFGITTIVPDMHTRKRLMATEVLNGSPGSGFIALPGGFGTLEEVMEIVTWNQLGIHDRGIVLLNVEGYWDELLQWIRHAVHEEFIGGGNERILVSCDKVADAVESLRNYRVTEGRLKLNWNLG
ncbi:lysine decarboxylase-domain-containing protein [Lipomyces doorenjongii]